jgi:hypothetical protein
MQLRRPAGIYQVFLMGVLVLATIVFTGRQHYGEAHNADEDQHAHHQTERVCRGFVVLPNGFAVLSSLPLSSAYASVGERQSTAHSGITIANTDHTADAPEYLLGYTHGQKIVLQDAMLCVPIVGAGTLKWTAVSHTAALLVIVESPKDTLLHGHRTNAAFTLTIRQGGGPIKHARALLLARMPQHNQHLPGGHGPANDPEVQGLVARPVGPGRYSIPTVAFTMAGPWLFEIHVQQGAETYKAYLAAYVGEE